MTATNPISIDENVICSLDELKVIKITGEDARTFLQGQFSNDVNGLENGHGQLNSYNSPKGRMYACFYLTCIDDAFFMLVPADIIDMLVKRLRMFIMRSQVTLEDMNTTIQCYGFHGAQTLNQLASKVNLPSNTLEATNSNGNILLKLNEKRLVAFGETIQQITESLDNSIIRTNNNHWRRLDIHAGIPNIFSASQEEFVAQMVNLPLIGGVSFTKGCYPGQEVVARMHYLGKLKKRMYRITIDTDKVPLPATNIYEKESGNTQSVGQIVDAQLNESGNVDALAVLQIKSAEESVLCLNSTDGPSITLQSLPYAFPE